MKKYMPSKLLLSFSIFFLPSFFTSPPPIQIEVHTIPRINMYQITREIVNQEISGSISYKTLSDQELHTLQQEKYKNIPKPSNEQLESWFSQYSNQYNISPDILKKIAYCESHYNPGAVNGPYGGMYQYSSSTWASTRSAMGGNPDSNLRFDPEESIKTTAFKIASGGIGAWPNCH